MTAGDVLGMLRRHYLPEGRPPGGIFAPEIGSPCGKRRADLIWLPTTTSRDAGLVGHEVKVSRSDVLAELTDPTKADPWAQYCQQWYLVISDPALVSGMDIPERWGILAPPSGRRTRTMTTLRRAPMLQPLEPAPGVTRVASWLMYRDHERITSLDGEVRHLRGDLELARRDLTDRAATSGRPLSPAEQRIRAVVVEADRLIRGMRGGEYLSELDLNANDVASAVLDAARLRAATRSASYDIQGRLREARRLLDPFADVLERLERIAKDTQAAVSASLPVDAEAGAA